MPNILDEILDYDLDFIECYLGKYGLGLRRFAKDIDHSHPDSMDVVGNKNSKKVCDYCRIIKFSIKNNLDIDLIDKNFLKKIKKVDSPFINKENIRLIKNKEDRNNLRKFKKVINISLDSFYKNSSYWYNVVDNFGIYCLENNVFKNKEIKKAQEIAERYRKQGCYELCEDINKSIDLFVKKFDKTNNGYHKISPVMASVILAKFCGFKCDNKICNKNKEYKPKLYPLYLFDEEFSKVEFFENFYGLNQSIFDNYFVLGDNDVCDGKFVLLGEKSQQYYFISIFFL